MAFLEGWCELKSIIFFLKSVVGALAAPDLIVSVQENID